MNPTSEPAIGRYGHAEPIDIPDLPDAAETVCTWLITSPGWHPLWTQFALFVVRLRDNVQGFPPPVRKFIGATHELIVVAVNPDHRWTADRVTQRLADGGGLPPYLTPVNIAEQFEATDDEMRDVASLAAQAVIHGALNPETADAPTRVREQWLAALTKTLAHMRGETHAS